MAPYPRIPLNRRLASTVLRRYDIPEKEQERTKRKGKKRRHDGSHPTTKRIGDVYFLVILPETLLHVIMVPIEIVLVREPRAHDPFGDLRPVPPSQPAGKRGNALLERAYNMGRFIAAYGFVPRPLQNATFGSRNDAWLTHGSVPAEVSCTNLILDMSSAGGGNHQQHMRVTPSQISGP